MIIYLLMTMFDSLHFALLSLIPTIETPVWITANLPGIMTKIAGFNYYLPVSEAVIVVVGLLGITLTWYIIKVVLSLFIDL